MRKEKTRLPNTIVKNVYSAICEELKNLEEQDFYSESRLARYHSFCVYEYHNEIHVDCSILLLPDDPKKFRRLQTTAFIFKALQLQTNTVKLKAECCASDLDSIFDGYWDEIIKDFLPPIENQVESNPEKNQESETPAHALKFLQIQGLTKEMSPIPENGSSIFVWLDYYHKEKKAGHKITFRMLETLSGYSHNTFKAEHGNFKRAREIDIPKA